MLVSKEIMISAINVSSSMRSCAEILGLSFSSFKRYAEKYGIYKPNQGGKGTKKKPGKSFALIDIFAGGHKNYGSSKLKKRLIDEKYKENKCESCGISSTWNSKPINLELDHINGDNKDNSLNNLRILCPNCHSQTDTFRGRSKKPLNKKLVSDEDLKKALLLTDNISQALIRVGLQPKGANYKRAYSLMNVTP